MHRQQSITHFTQKFSFIKSTQILSERHFESLQCFYFFTYHQYVMKFFFLLFSFKRSFFRLCQGVFGEIFTVHRICWTFFRLFYANSDFPLWKFVRKISKIRRWKKSIIRIDRTVSSDSFHSDILFFFTISIFRPRNSFQKEFSADIVQNGLLEMGAWLKISKTAIKKQ